jgi:hypothetical protein
VRREELEILFPLLRERARVRAKSVFHTWYSATPKFLGRRTHSLS